MISRNFNSARLKRLQNYFCDCCTVGHTLRDPLVLVHMCTLVINFRWWKFSWTAGSTTKITKISTPWKLPAIRYIRTQVRVSFTTWAPVSMTLLTVSGQHSEATVSSISFFSCSATVGGMLQWTCKNGGEGKRCLSRAEKDTHGTDGNYWGRRTLHILRLSCHSWKILSIILIKIAKPKTSITLQ